MTNEEAIAVLQKLKTRCGTDDMKTTIRMARENEAIDIGIASIMKDQQIPKWIPCDEKLPDEGELVMTLIFGHDVIVQVENETMEQAIERTSKMKRTSAGFIGSDGWYGIDGFPEICTPKYWMPFPNVPTEVL